MTLRSRRKHPITAPNSPPRKTATKFARWRALLAAAIASAGCWTALAGSGLAADTSEPELFRPPADARLLTAANTSRNSPSAAKSSFEITESGGTLRWRPKQSLTSSAKSAVTITDTKPSKATSAVTPATFNNPLDDPFGDRKAVRTAQAEQPADNAQPADDAQPPMNLNPPAARQAPPAQAPPTPMPMPMTQPLPTPMDMLPPRAGLQYNQRDCSADGKNCAEARLRMEEDRLVNKIGLLDTTPPLYLTESNREGELKRFSRTPRREWRDRTGRVIVTGKLEGVAYRHLQVRGDDGEITKIPLHQLGDDEQCFLAAWWNVPTECMLGDKPHPGRDFIASTFTFTASALCNKPLYFEETQLERYGHVAPLQPVLSGAHFFLNIAVLPYKMGINPPNECQYALGYYRPGSCAPWLVPPIPLSLRGAATQAAVVGGIVPLIP